MRLVAILLVASWLQSSDAGPKTSQHAEGRPRFEDYLVDNVFRGRPSKFVWPKGLDLNEPYSEKMISAVRDTLPRTPNFAGHYAIVRYSGGTNCGEITVVDMKSGQVFNDGPYGTLDTNFDTKEGPLYKGLSFRTQSRLLIASGCFDWDAPESAHQCGTKYFDFKDNHFALLEYVPGAVPQRMRTHK